MERSMKGEMRERLELLCVAIRSKDWKCYGETEVEIRNIPAVEGPLAARSTGPLAMTCQRFAH